MRDEVHQGLQVTRRVWLALVCILGGDNCDETVAVQAAQGVLNLGTEGP